MQVQQRQDINVEKRVADYHKYPLNETTTSLKQSKHHSTEVFGRAQPG